MGVQGKSLSALRQKLRKYIRESHEDDVAKFRENPDEDDDEPEDVADEEGSGDDDDTDFSRAKSKEKEMKTKKKKDFDDDDSDEWMSSEESSESSDDHIVSASVYTREMFLKK